MTLKRWLLGFDLRACRKDYVSREGARERRVRYLLNSDVQWPLSVDTAAWPSLFHFTSRLQNYRPIETVPVEPANGRQLVLRLWDDVAAMEATLRNSALQEICFVRTAVELCGERNIFESGPWEVVGGSLPQNRTMSDWKSVGFDVADSDLVSGLMNCDYEQDERAELSAWSKELNKYGLFDDVERASEFRRLVDQRVPQHAPFVVYHLLADLNRDR